MSTQEGYIVIRFNKDNSPHMRIMECGSAAVFPSLFRCLEVAAREPHNNVMVVQITPAARALRIPDWTIRLFAETVELAERRHKLNNFLLNPQDLPAETLSLMAKQRATMDDLLKILRRRLANAIPELQENLP